MAININIEERSYGGKKFRPRTYVEFEKSNNLLLCITPWGKPDIANKVAQSIKSFVTMAHEDSELTVPYARKETLQQMGNILRMAVIMASEKIYHEFNQDEYTSGFEIFAAVQDGPQWIFVSCGQPSLIINRENLGTIPLSQAVDMNVLTLRSLIHDPLPNQLLGLGQHPPIQFGNIRLKKTDRLALVSRTYLPSDFYKINSSNFDSNNIARILSSENQEVPFWLGFLNIN